MVQLMVHWLCRQADLVAGDASSVAGYDDAAEDVLHDGRAEAGGIGIDEDHERVVGQDLFTGGDEFVDLLLELPDFPAGPSSVGGRVHDDDVVLVAAADLALDELGAVIDDPVDGAVGQAGGVSFSLD